MSTENCGFNMRSIVFDDHDHMIEIDSQIIDRIFEYRQTDKYHMEAGGVIIGRELKSTGNLIIEEMTEPQFLDKQSRFRFERKDPAHKEYFEELYLKADKTYGYFGEWHTHPESIPDYSATDKRNWIKLYQELPQKHTLYFIIAGIDSVGVWKIERSFSKQPVEVFRSNWNHLLSEVQCREE